MFRQPKSSARRIQDLMAETEIPHKLEDAKHRALLTEHLESLAEGALADRRCLFRFDC